MRAAAVQLTSTADRDRNLEAADRLTRAAAAARAPSSSCCPRSGRCSARPSRPPRAPSRSTAPRCTWARGDRARARHRPRRRLDRRARRRRRRAARNTSRALRPRRRGAARPTARSTCSTSRSAGASTASPSTRRRATRSSSRETADGVELGPEHLLRPALPRALPRSSPCAGARVLAVPAAFTLATTREHWEVLLRARAIEDQAFVVAANQVGEHAPGIRSGGRSMIVDPWGVVLAQAPDAETFVDRRPRPRAPGRDPPHAAVARQPPPGGLPLADGGRTPSGARKPAPSTSAGSSSTPRCACSRARASTPAGCRTSPTRRGVAYGLVYHYFESKDEVLDTLFLERWDVLLEAIREIDARDDPRAREAARDRVVHRRLLPPRPRPDEGDHRRGHARGELVRRARTCARSARPTRLIAGIVAQGAGRRRVPRQRSPPEFAAMAFYGAIEQVLTGWIFGLLERGRRRLRAGQATTSSGRSATASRRIATSARLRRP